MDAGAGQAEQRAATGYLLFGLSQIEQFRAEPNKFSPPPAVPMPPGAPIGTPGLHFVD